MPDRVVPATAEQFHDHGARENVRVASFKPDNKLGLPVRQLLPGHALASATRLFSPPDEAFFA